MTKEEREKAKAYFQSRLEWHKENRYPYVSAQEAEACKTALEALELSKLSSVNLQPKTGHWIYKQYGSYPEQGDYHCSECDGIDNRIPAYCPNCGAKMQEVEE